MSQRRPRISIVIPHFDDLSGLTRALRSLKVQDTRDFEVVIVDDGSPLAVRRELSVLAGSCDFEIVTFFHIANRGASAARNSGLMAARGQIICLLDSDDIFLAGKLSWVLSRFSDEAVRLVIHRYRNWSSEVVDGRGFMSFIQRWPWWLIAIRNPSVTPAVSFRHDPAVTFNEQFRRFDDQLFLVNYTKRNGPAVVETFVGTGVPKPIIGVGGLSGRFWPMLRAEMQFISTLPCNGALGIVIAGLLFTMLPLRVMRRIGRIGLIGWKHARRTAGA